MLGSCADGKFSTESIYFALIAGGLVALTKFKDYWTAKGNIYKVGLFNFI